MIVNKNQFEDKNGQTVEVVNFIFNEKNVKQTKSGKAFICTCFLNEKIDTVAGEIPLKELIKLDLLKFAKSKIEYLTDSINDLTDEEKAKLKALLK